MHEPDLLGSFSARGKAAAEYKVTAEHLGFIAGAITTVSFVPQVIRVYKNKSGRDVSAWMMLLLAAGTMLWLIYGILIGGVPIVAANAVTFTLVVIIFVLKLYYARRG